MIRTDALTSRQEQLDYTLEQAAHALGMKPVALRVFLHRHPDLSEPRYLDAPRQRAQYRRRVLTRDELERVRRRRFLRG